jgi:thiol-disulfide isomerase/thioredoxin
MKIFWTIIVLIIFSVKLQAQQQQETSTHYYNAIKSEADPLKKEKLLIDWENLAGSGSKEIQGFNLIDFSRQLVAQAFAEENNVEKAKYWIYRIEDYAGKTNSELYLVSELTSKDKLEEAEKFLLQVYDRLKSDTVNTQPGSGLTPMPTTAVCEQLYATILYKKGEFKKALQYLKPPSNDAGRRGDSGELYALSLAKSGETEKAIEVITQVVFAPGHRSDDFKVTAQNLFFKKYGNEKQFRQLMDSAATIEKQKIEAKIASMETNVPAPDFELIDLNGNKVSLKSLHGKTVVLDFWATWCQPCIASFPGMQKAVDFYKNDSSVVFMFIHTMEKNDNALVEVQDFMKYRKFRFDVYLDLKNKSTKLSPVAQSFGVQGIPAKFVINRKGVIKYSHAGYVGEDEAVDEIKLMIELANK